MGKKKKSSRLSMTTAPDFNRSVSVPAERFNRTLNKMQSPEEIDSG